MAVTEGRNGKITVRTTAANNVTVAEMGSWSISGWTRDMVEHSAFQDTAKRWKPGLLDGGQVQFSGYYDPSNSSGQGKLIAAFTSGKAISNATTLKIRKMRFWGSDDTALPNYGFWSVIGSSGSLYITSMELGQEKSGLGSLSMTAKVSEGMLAWSTTT